MDILLFDEATGEELWMAVSDTWQKPYGGCSPNYILTAHI